MAKQFWINLPVKDVRKSKEFFAKLGFRFNEQMNKTDEMASLLLGDQNVVVMLFTEAAFTGFGQNPVADTNQGTEVLLSIDAETREEVDEMARKAVDAGGTLYGNPGEKDGWMYGCGFVDLDGHRWNILHMDMSKMPQ